MHYTLAFLLTISMLGCSHAQPTQTNAPGADSTPPSPPVAGPEAVSAENCDNLSWLLTHYDLERLASGSSPGPNTGFPLACCAPEALGGQDFRCEHDWPSSDVVACSLWRDYHETLLATYPLPPRPEQVERNLAGLKRWFEEKHQCMSEGEPTQTPERLTLRLVPRHLTYAPDEGLVYFDPDAGVKRASYTQYAISLASLAALLGAKPASPVDVLIEVTHREVRRTKSAPNTPQPDGGFTHTLVHAKIVALP